MGSGVAELPLNWIHGGFGGGRTGNHFVPFTISTVDHDHCTRMMLSWR